MSATVTNLEELLDYKTVPFVFAVEAANCKAYWTQTLKHGRGNGYVAIPPQHKRYGKESGELYDLYPDLDVHGGITYSELADEFVEVGYLSPRYTGRRVVGFDTRHYMDDLIRRPDEASVLREATKLLNFINDNDDT